MRIKTIKNVSDNYQLSLSTDDKKNVNIIVGRCGSGKTALFNRIKFCLARTEDDGGIEMELSGEADCDMEDIFVGGSERLAAYGHEDILRRINGSGFAEDLWQTSSGERTVCCKAFTARLIRNGDCYD